MIHAIFRDQACSDIDDGGAVDNHVMSHQQFLLHRGQNNSIRIGGILIIANLYNISVANS